MSEQNKPFVITDRRKFTLDGEARPDADPPTEKEHREAPAPVESAAPAASPEQPSAAASTPEPSAENEDEQIPPGPTAEQSDQARRAYEMTAERLDTAIRASNPGMDHPPAMNFEQLVQSVYMTAIMQLGGATPEGQAPQVDILGARQSIEMLAVLNEKTAGNLSGDEKKLLDSALFELHMAFLEVTQALARSAAARAGHPGQPGDPLRPGPAGPSIVR